MAEKRDEGSSPPRRITKSKRALRSDDDDSSPPKNPSVTVIKEEPPDEEEEAKTLECAVCLQTCIHPARLPCKHIFCFLCLKGITHGSRQCAMCRSPIPADYLDHPDLLEMPSCSTDHSQEGYQWFYEGRNGWWQYDPRASIDLEAAYNNEEGTCELLIAGYLYVVDLREMVQYRKNEPGKKRRIKRDLASAPRKGVAGLRQPLSPPPSPSLSPVDLVQILEELTVYDSDDEASSSSGGFPPTP